MAIVKVLIVDDDKMVLDVIASYLDRSDGYEILTTSSPQDALEIAKNTPIDLLIADIMMPGILGPKLFQEIKQMSPKTACILISGYEKDMYHLPSDVLFLKKPFDTNTLFSAIREAMAQSE